MGLDSHNLRGSEGFGVWTSRSLSHVAHNNKEFLGLRKSFLLS